MTIDTLPTSDPFKAPFVSIKNWTEEEKAQVRRRINEKLRAQGDLRPMGVPADRTQTSEEMKARSFRVDQARQEAKQEILDQRERARKAREGIESWGEFS